MAPIISVITFLLIFREMDRDVVGAAASIFIVSSIKVPNHTNELISTEMNHELPDQRINAILRFQVNLFIFLLVRKKTLTNTFNRKIKSIMK